MDSRDSLGSWFRFGGAGMALLLLVSACGGGGSSADSATAGDLVAAVRADTLNAGYVSAVVAATDPGLSALLVPKYDVDYYIVSYRTPDPAGDLVTASGLLLVPKKPSGSLSPVVSVQHGTIQTQGSAPSALDPSGGYTSDTAGAVIAASLGFIAVMPDYLGYGVSAQVFHPYVQAGTLASATVNLLRATRTQLQRLGVATNDQLFLAGYSEGGYATMAAQRLMETELGNEFNLTAVEAGSGPYDLSTTTQTVLASSDLAGVTDPRYLAFVMDAYQHYYGGSLALADLFTPQALACVEQFYSAGWYGAASSGDTFSSCVNTTVTNQIIQQTLIDAFGNDSANVAPLRQAIADNDIYDWKPQVPTRLFYSPYDEAVPPANTDKAYQTMTNNGSTTLSTATCGVNSADSFHNACQLPFLENTLNFFAGYVHDL